MDGLHVEVIDAERRRVRKVRIRRADAEVRAPRGESHPPATSLERGGGSPAANR
jgi:hypothetical protein